ncbi:23S rRNA (pseudouridine(1915)-N(3))-methyltransferase RlmH [Sphingobacterium yanglingense]|uniref:Ribosomal RNA large subunit methyltransferase H n=1 Tax=Sphingobacterium yanglingense TaxID=1437280 RepID=A0A4R6WM98_9SPHI|nr:23S rRNA (pseudouridine(1915)-N(3))-methyltransferase RlmH [Sphingobacterium yanglingense]TDQ79912.1 23S rRNA (pseudouridine1915-N3)-methyltransferase [Sphingobacterium yanglingense]
MKISLLCIGKTDDKFIQEGIDKYLKRLKHYITFNISILPDVKNVKNMSAMQQMDKEAEFFLKNLTNTDFVVLLDEKGKEFRSVEFADYLQQKMITSVQHVVFLIGGPYGFAAKVRERANAQMSLSKLTFSHQMVRLFFVEQVYRAFTIMKGEPYHHE